MYKYYNKYNYNLFKAFIIDFLDQTKETFKLASLDVNQRFCNFLRYNSVYIAIDRSFITTYLAELVNKEELPKQLLDKL